MDKSQTVLTILIRADSSKRTYSRHIKKTLKSLALNDEDLASVNVAVVFNSEEDCDSKLSRQFEKKDGFTVVSMDRLPDIKKGRYIMAIRQGDAVNMNRIRRAAADMKQNDRGVYWFRRTEKAKTAGRNTSDEEWKSIFTSPFTDTACFNPRGVAVRNDLAEPVADLMRNDAPAYGLTLKAVLSSRGFYWMGSADPIISEPGSDDFRYELDFDVVDDVILHCRKLYSCIEQYLQKAILELIKYQMGPKGSKESVCRYLPNIDDDIILDSKILNAREKVWLMDLKFDTDVLKESRITDSGNIIFNDSQQVLTLKDLRFRIDVTELNGNELTFEGRSELHLLGSGYDLYIMSSNGTRTDIELIPFPPFDIEGPDGELICEGRRFCVTVPAEDGLAYRICLEEKGGRVFHILPVFSNYSGFAQGNVVKTAKRGNFNIVHREGEFYIEKKTAKNSRRYEIGYLKFLMSKKLYYVVLYRILYYIDRFFFRKPVWIVADRPHKANDNGEHMFKYLQTTEAAKKNTIYFLLREDSPDFARVKKEGKVLKYGSHKHKIKFLRSQVILCAAANDLAINAMGGNGKYYRDLYNYDFVYLRHGVSHNDMSSWINKLAKNISLLVATCRPEYEGVLSGDYDYTEKQVKLTGLPRYDNLYDEKEKEILILPTWRKNLQGEMEYRSSEREYVDDFTDSDYFKFYDALINDERLLSVMEEYGYKGTFYLHPVFEKQYKDFKSSRLISVGKGIADYQELFRKSAIMVTDYSSVAFDFAFLKKPVIYSQFDEEVFYLNHSWGKGYFTYRKDGFGPITTTVEDTVNELIYYIKNDCRMKQEYVTKVENFFAYTDRNNCKRVYEAVMEMERSKNQK